MKKALLISIAAAMILFGFAAVGHAYTNTQVGIANQFLSDGSTVVITVSARPKLTLTMPDLVDFGAVDPETAYSQAYGIQVKSNRNFTVDRGAPGGDAALMNLVVTGDASGPKALGNVNMVENADINIPMTTSADTALNATVQYTVTQVP